jgi:hypothetical protein
VKVALEGPRLGALDLGDALDTATRQKHEEVAAMLKAAGAQALPPPEAKLERAVLERYVGEWVSEARGPNVVIELGEAGLSGRLLGDVIPLAAYDERTFRALKPPGPLLTFELEGREPTALRVTGSGNERVFKRAGGGRKP